MPPLGAIREGSDQPTGAAEASPPSAIQICRARERHEMIRARAHARLDQFAVAMQVNEAQVRIADPQQVAVAMLQRGAGKDKLLAAFAPRADFLLQ
jgi:hypothetical protein